MTEPIIICLINSAVTFATDFLSRWLSHKEHKETSADIKEIRGAINGKDSE